VEILRNKFVRADVIRKRVYNVYIIALKEYLLKKYREEMIHGNAI
jgi:hypothetical protein